MTKTMCLVGLLSLYACSFVPDFMFFRAKTNFLLLYFKLVFIFVFIFASAFNQTII